MRSISSACGPFAGEIADRCDAGQRRRVAGVLDQREFSVDVVLASACLPLIHHTIEIDGEPYWTVVTPPIRR